MIPRQKYGRVDSLQKQFATSAHVATNLHAGKKQDKASILDYVHHKCLTRIKWDPEITRYFRVVSLFKGPWSTSSLTISAISAFLKTSIHGGVDPYCHPFQYAGRCELVHLGSKSTAGGGVAGSSSNPWGSQTCAAPHGEWTPCSRGPALGDRCRKDFTVWWWIEMKIEYLLEGWYRESCKHATISASWNIGIHSWVIL